MSRAYADRVINLSFCPDDLKFESGEHQLAFQAALGRLIMYGLQSHADGESSFTTIGIDKRLEMTACHWGKVQYAPFVPGTLSEFEQHSRLTGDLARLHQPKGCFVLGAVPRDEGLTYSFHS